MGSSPTPGAIHLGFVPTVNDDRIKNVNCRKDRQNSSKPATRTTEVYRYLTKRIETATKSLSISYYKDTLLKLAQRNPENAKDICNYIIVEKTEINIKISTARNRDKGSCLVIKFL